MSFLPDNYEAPPKTGGHFFKPPAGESRVRVVGSAVVGWLGWDKSGEKPKPERSRDRQGVEHLATPGDEIKFFWAFPVLVRDGGTGTVAIWEVTQSTIQDAIEGLVKDSDWGSPLEYDIKINKQGQKLETTYHITPAPKTPTDLTSEQSTIIGGIDMDQLFTGGDPFDDIPF